MSNVLGYYDPISKFGWSIYQMTNTDNTRQSFVGEIIDGAVKEFGAKWLITDTGRMWLNTFPDLGMDVDEIYKQTLKVTPHCVPCDLGQWKAEGNADKLTSTRRKIEPCFDCDSLEVLHDLAVRQERSRLNRPY